MSEGPRVRTANVGVNYGVTVPPRALFDAERAGRAIYANNDYARLPRMAPPSGGRRVRQVPGQTVGLAKELQADGWATRTTAVSTSMARNVSTTLCLDQWPRCQALSLDNRLRAHAELHEPRHHGQPHHVPAAPLQSRATSLRTMMEPLGYIPPPRPSRATTP
jgi:hypothetical protein